MSQDRGHTKLVGPAVIRLTMNILPVHSSTGADEVHSDNSADNKDRNRTLLEWDCASMNNGNGKWLRGGWRWGRVGGGEENDTCPCRTQYLLNAHTQVEQSTNLEHFCVPRLNLYRWQEILHQRWGQHFHTSGQLFPSPRFHFQETDVWLLSEFLLWMCGHQYVWTLQGKTKGHYLCTVIPSWTELEELYVAGWMALCSSVSGHGSPQLKQDYYLSTWWMEW